MKKIEQTYKSFFVLIIFLLFSATLTSGDNIKNGNSRPSYYTLMVGKTIYSSTLNLNLRPKDEALNKNTHNKSIADTPIIMLLAVSIFLIIIQVLKKIKSHYLAKLKYLKADNEKLKREIEESKSEYRKLFPYLNHELKNTLNSVQCASSLLYEHYSGLDKEERETLIGTITNSTGFLGEYFDTLSTWSQIEWDIEKSRPEKFEILPVVVEEISKLNQLINSKKAGIKIDIRDKSYAYMDLSMFHIVISNLISNAVKYSNNGGKVIITAKDLDDNVEITVQDFGVGISKDKLDRMFELKTIFNTNGPDGEKGTGLGLIICKKYIEFAKGKLIVESKKGEGSLFKITIPEHIILNSSI